MKKTLNYEDLIRASQPARLSLQHVKKESRLSQLKEGTIVWSCAFSTRRQRRHSPFRGSASAVTSGLAPPYLSLVSIYTGSPPSLARNDDLGEDAKFTLFPSLTLKQHASLKTRFMRTLSRPCMRIKGADNSDESRLWQMQAFECCIPR